jgi:ribosomal protein S21
MTARFAEYRVKQTLEGGREVVVQNGRVNSAFNQLNRLCEEGQVRALAKRSRYYIKPKHRRQQMEQEYHDRKRSASFREKLAAAYELMKSGY